MNLITEILEAQQDFAIKLGRYLSGRIAWMKRGRESQIQEGLVKKIKISLTLENENGPKVIKKAYLIVECDGEKEVIHLDDIEMGYLD